MRVLAVGASANIDTVVNACSAASAADAESTQALSSLSGGGVVIGIVSYRSLSRIASLLHTANAHWGNTRTNMACGLDNTQADDVNARITVSVEPLNVRGGMLTNTKVQKTQAKPTARTTRSAAEKKVEGAHRGPESNTGLGGNIVYNTGATMKIKNGRSVLSSGP